MRHALPAFALPLLLLAGCQQAAKQPDAPAAQPATTSPTPTAAPAAARQDKDSNALFEFDYTYPAQAAAIPALKALLDADLVKARAELANDAREAAADAKTNGYPFNPHSFSTNWQVVTDLPGWLSLSTTVGMYSGGAHPNYNFDTLLWDKAANTRRTPLELFTAKSALFAAITKPFCAALNQQRTQKRGTPVNPDSTDDFDKCIDPLGETLILGSADRQHFTRLGILVAPYEAGPYAEGDYEVTLPITPAILATVKPEYRASFAASR